MDHAVCRALGTLDESDAALVLSGTQASGRQTWKSWSYASMTSARVEERVQTMAALSHQLNPSLSEPPFPLGGID